MSLPELLGVILSGPWIPQPSISFLWWIGLILLFLQGALWVFLLWITTSFKSLPMWHVISYGSTGIKLFMMAFLLMPAMFL
jgi:hypothetical protein